MTMCETLVTFHHCFFPKMKTQPHLPPILTATPLTLFRKCSGVLGTIVMHLGIGGWFGRRCPIVQFVVSPIIITMQKKIGSGSYAIFPKKKGLLTIATFPFQWISMQFVSTTSSSCASALTPPPPPDWKHKTRELYGSMKMSHTKKNFHA